MRALFVASCPKEPADPDANEDRYAFSDDGRRFALCDGASESYDSRLWARLLCEKYAADPALTGEWLDGVIASYRAAHDFESMSWSQQLAYDRGCFATILGVEHDVSRRCLDVLAIGDTVALLLDAGSLVEAWPFSDPDRFHERPTLMSALAAQNEFMREEGFWNRSLRTIELGAYTAPTLACMTDAVGEWALRGVRDGVGNLAKLLALRSASDFVDLVVEERAAKRMRLDDSTLVILAFDAEPSDDGLPQP